MPNVLPFKGYGWLKTSSLVAEYQLKNQWGWDKATIAALRAAHEPILMVNPNNPDAGTNPENRAWRLWYKALASAFFKQYQNASETAMNPTPGLSQALQDQAPAPAVTPQVVQPTGPDPLDRLSTTQIKDGQVYTTKDLVALTGFPQYAIWRFKHGLFIKPEWVVIDGRKNLAFNADQARQILEALYILKTSGRPLAEVCETISGQPYPPEGVKQRKNPDKQEQEPTVPEPTPQPLATHMIPVDLETHVPAEPFIGLDPPGQYPMVANTIEVQLTLRNSIRMGPFSVPESKLTALLDLLLS